MFPPAACAQNKAKMAAVVLLAAVSVLSAWQQSKSPRGQVCVCLSMSIVSVCICQHLHMGIGLWRMIACVSMNTVCVSIYENACVSLCKYEHCLCELCVEEVRGGGGPGLS